MKFKWLSILLSCAAFLSVVIYNKVFSAPSTNAEGQIIQTGLENQINNMPQVETISVIAKQYSPKIIGFGEVTPKFELSLKSDVSGKIVHLNKRFVSGTKINKGTVVASVDDTPYIAALAKAQAQEAQALVKLQEEQRQGDVAYRDWLRNKEGGQKATPLILREPQLKAAKAEYEHAKLAVKKAQQDLDNTKIKAPFDAIVVDVSVQPGSYIQPGTQIGQLHSSEKVEIHVPLSEQQWLQLQDTISKSSARLNQVVALYSTLDETTTWTGEIERVERHLNRDTRQRSLIISVTEPLLQSTPLYSGTFVKVVIDGKAQDSLYKLPSSAVSQNGNVWFVDKQGQLNKYRASNVFSYHNNVYIKSLNNQPLQIVKRPLSHFSEGMSVQVIEGTML
ncbi:hemolysin D [Pseudoalteromonas sp. A25]|uniref:efflux RND transporter periplasmic adaptor subunit n=1 Tax=Pseudoalteromonas sp. A25 TaxID=116092 RepID=UPI0012610922|nr:efflux RND transporter periplasmic adaptor subunit [Pseudoalteromonas sp. A25]BBN81704.1 hemolysin D [Pseudoalteromonas sp. A25]